MQIEPKKLPLKQQGYSAAFDMEFLNSSKLKIVFFICYSVPRKIATDSGPKYEWDLVTRDHCTKGCPVSAPPPAHVSHMPHHIRVPHNACNQRL